MVACLQLVRLPTVFTAMADVILGFVLTHHHIVGPDGWDHPRQFFALLVGSCCLYMSGMVFNDVFDRRQDAAERPGRPIPSGRVSVKGAVVLGCCLMLVGVSASASVGWISLQVAGLLVIAILAYDGVLKQTPLGPMAMGSCRLLNVLLGASAQAGIWMTSTILVNPQATAALGLGTYIVGVTVFARTEAKTSSRWQLALAQILFNSGIAILAWLVCSWPNAAWPPVGNGWVTLIMLGVIAFTINRRAIGAILDPSPMTVQTTIKMLLLSYVMLDATLVLWKLHSPDSSWGAAHALATAFLIIPAMILSKFVPMT